MVQNTNNQGLNGAQFLMAFFIMNGVILLAIEIFFVVDWWRHR